MDGKLVLEPKEFNRLLSMWLYACGNVSSRCQVTGLEVTDKGVEISLIQEPHVESKSLL